MPLGSPHSPPIDDRRLADDAVALVVDWLRAARDAETDETRARTAQLHALVDDPDGIGFTMQFVDRVVRPDDNAIAAAQLHALVVGSDGHRAPLPRFLGRIDRLLLRAGAHLAPRLPRLVMPLARRRMRQIVGHLVVDADPAALETHLGARRDAGFDLNVNLLGEAVLGEEEAALRLQRTIDLLGDGHVDYVSVKISAVASQLNHWAWDDSLDRIGAALRTILRAAAAHDTFVNLDMEEYHDLELTIAAFTRVLDEDEFLDVRAGIVLQTYLPDSFDALGRLVDWSTLRHERGGADIKIRLVKGANLAMERVDAAMHGWTPAPYATKAEVDANYKRCVDWALTGPRTRAVRYGIASHNLFDVAFAVLVAAQRDVADRIEIEMLEGMAPAQADVVKGHTGALLLYTPVVSPDDFDVAISYLFRRLEENAAPGNFLRALLDLDPDSATFAAQEQAFRTAVDDRWSTSTASRRDLDRNERVHHPARNDAFDNDPETDATVAANRDWVVRHLGREPGPPRTPVLDDDDQLDAHLATARAAQTAWAAVPASDRRRILWSVADELDRRRGDLVAAMAHEAGKTFAQADPEICEAIDFARYYGDRARDLPDPPLPVSDDAGLFADAPTTAPEARFEPLGVVAVVPPWNFPVAIPAGGCLAALAAGNAVVLKPAPQTPRCAEIVAESCWAAGVPGDVLQFVRAPENDLGRRLVTETDAVILTGAGATADLFRSWKPELRIFAETSGKNAMVITPNADIDLAVKDLVDSAFGHAGQKCSAASLAICVGGVHDSPRFRRQLRDAVQSLAVGPGSQITTTVNGIIEAPNPDLLRALTQLDDGEEWLVRPHPLDDADPAAARLWQPGVRVGVRPGSWFHRTECFGPVLGLIAADDLDDALAIQNSSCFGLTGGIQSLDPSEVERWTARVEVGNAYVNRGTTGAIVQRQPFGGWKGSVVGPGAKAGGPNYVRQLGTWHDDRPRNAAWLAAASADDDTTWRTEFGVTHDPTGLFCEENLFRYRPLPVAAVRVGPDADPFEVERVLAAARRCGTRLVVSRADGERAERFAARIADLGVERIRAVGAAEPDVVAAGASAGVHVDTSPVTGFGRVELLHYLREQAVSTTLHRFGNLVGARVRSTGTGRGTEVDGR